MIHPTFTGRGCQDACLSYHSPSYTYALALTPSQRCHAFSHPLSLHLCCGCTRTECNWAHGVPGVSLVRSDFVTGEVPRNYSSSRYPPRGPRTLIRPRHTTPLMPNSSSPLPQCSRLSLHPLNLTYSSKPRLLPYPANCFRDSFRELRSLNDLLGHIESDGFPNSRLSPLSLSGAPKPCRAPICPSGHSSVLYSSGG